MIYFYSFRRYYFHQKDTGIYEFALAATGDKVKARYSFNYVQEDGQWKIQHHHSSVMPEGIATGARR